MMARFSSSPGKSSPSATLPPITVKNTPLRPLLKLCTASAKLRDLDSSQNRRRSMPASSRGRMDLSIS